MSENFNHRFTVLPDSGVIELHCSTHRPSARHWPVGYHPSLDVLIEHAHAHNLTEHAGESPQSASQRRRMDAQAAPEIAAATAERDDLREQLAAADRATAEFRRQCSELAGELGAARAVVREMDAHIASGDDYADPAKRAGWRQRAGIGDGQAAASAPDVRPRDGKPGWYDVTCGICGEESGTNFRVEEIECAECEAKRCPHCGGWFGGER